MKRILSAVMAIFMVCFLAVTVFATEFVPSISEKGAPELVPVGEENGKKIYGYVIDKDGNVLETVYEGDILITPISEVDISPYISKDAAQLLKDTYQDLLDKPDYFGEDKVVRELVDISVSARLAKALQGEGTTLTLTFDIGLEKNAAIWVQSLINDKWGEIVNARNNNEGTVTGVFEDFCPVVFLVEADAGCGCWCWWCSLGLWCCCWWCWILLVLLCILTIVILILWYRLRKAKQTESLEEAPKQVEDKVQDEPQGQE